MDHRPYPGTHPGALSLTGDPMSDDSTPPRSSPRPGGSLSPAQLILALVGVAVVVFALILWKGQRRESAREILETRFAAEIEADPGDPEALMVILSHESLTDLVTVAPLIASLGRVTLLDLSGSPNLETLDGASAIPTLIHLQAMDCPRLRSISGISGLPELSVATIQACPSLERVDDLANLPGLVMLDLPGATGLRSLSLAGLPALKGLTLSEASELSVLDLTPAPLLEQLYLEGCRSLSSLTGLEKAAALTDLNVSTCHQLRRLEGLGDLESLIMLDARNCPAGAALEAIGRLPALKVLRLGGQPELVDLTPLSRLEQLEEIHIEGCENLESLRGMPASLTGYAAFSHSPKLASAAGVENAVALERIDFSGCSALTDIGALAWLKSLREVNLGGCRAVIDVTILSKLPELEIVQLGGSGVAPALLADLQKERPTVIFDFSGGGEF